MTVVPGKILITGGAGLIGSHIAERCLAIGDSEVIVIDNFTRGRRENLASCLEDSNLRIIEGDILDQGLLIELMTGVDIVFHQAALRITQCAEEPRLANDVLVNGTFNVLETAVKTNVKKVVSASSASIYGAAEEFPTAENHHPFNNRTLYGAAKSYNEGLLRSFHEMYGLNYVALRYFNVYGPRMDIHGVYTEVLIRWMERIAVGKRPLIFGDGNQTMDFIYVDDIARANILAATSDVTDEVFNVAWGTEVSLNELVQTLLAAMNSNLGIEYGPERKVNPVPRRLADVRKAEELLGFRASVTLEQGLQNLVTWWGSQETNTTS